MKKELVQRLPKEIIYIIISYTYKFQDKQMLEDIKNFIETRKTILTLYRTFWIDTWNEFELEDKNWLVNDLHAYANNYKASMYGYVDNFYNIFKRNFLLKQKTDEELDNSIRIIERTPVNRQINFFLGLFFPKERNDVIIFITNMINTHPR
jgi:hypothetical protein